MLNNRADLEEFEFSGLLATILADLERCPFLGKTRCWTKGGTNLPYNTLMMIHRVHIERV
jgi:hypothetical protein